MGDVRTVTVTRSCDRCDERVDFHEKVGGPKGWQHVDVPDGNPLGTTMLLCPACLDGLQKYLKPLKEKK